MASVKKGITNYFKYASIGRLRATRTEYWVGLAFSLLGIASYVGARLLLPSSTHGVATPTPASHLILGFSLTVLSLILTLPGISMTIRRIHDFDKSGWLYFALVTGPIAAFAFGVIPGTEGQNKYGHDPRDPEYHLTKDEIPPASKQTDFSFKRVGITLIFALGLLAAVYWKLTKSH